MITVTDKKLNEQITINKLSALVPYGPSAFNKIKGENYGKIRLHSMSVRL